jgi:hypothetical protein
MVSPKVDGKDYRVGAQDEYHSSMNIVYTI